LTLSQGAARQRRKAKPRGRKRRQNPGKTAVRSNLSSRRKQSGWVVGRPVPCFWNLDPADGHRDTDTDTGWVKSAAADASSSGGFGRCDDYATLTGDRHVFFFPSALRDADEQDGGRRTGTW